jgi:O-antigen/teichoic acid export membrane protein
MSATLKSRAIQGVFWSLLDRVGQQGILFVIAIILARFLAPEQFGLVGMLSVFIEVARVFIDSGFGAALIQRKEVTKVDECSIFYFSLFTGLVAAGLLCAIAPSIAGFYKQPILAPLMYTLSVTLVLPSLSSVQNALLSKRIDFKTQLKVGLSATALSGIIGVTMAVRGFGVWSLAAQYIGNGFFRTVLFWLLDPWRPKWMFRFAALREMFGFGSRLLASTLLNTIFENIYLVVIGKLFSAAHLGLYSGARKIQSMATINITGVVMQVAFPVFSAIQDDPVRLKRSMRKAMMMLALVNFPIMAGLALTARPVVYVLLTEKWAACVHWLQLLCIAGLLYPFQSLHLNVLIAKGRSDLFFFLEVIKKILIVILIAITCRWGVTGMLWGQIAMSVLGYYINSYYTTRLIGYSLKEQLADLAPYAAISALMGVGVYLVRLVPFAGDALLLAAEVLLGITLYVVLSYVFRLPAFLETAQAIREKLRSRALSFGRS